MKGQEIVKLFEIAGKTEEAEQLKYQLKKVMAAKVQLEKIARLDFNKPTKKLIEIAEQNGVNIYDDDIKNEF